MGPVKSSVADVIISSITPEFSYQLTDCRHIGSSSSEAGLSDMVWSGALWVFSESQWVCIRKSAQDG